MMGGLRLAGSDDSRLGTGRDKMMGGSGLAGIR